MSKRRVKTKWQEIIFHWQYPKMMKHYPLAYTKLLDKPLLMQKFCFACGRIGHVERAHIRSEHNGGLDVPENLHLLCAGCHKESEFLENEMYWMWFNSVDPISTFKEVAKRFSFLITSNSIELK